MDLYIIYRSVYLMPFTTANEAEETKQLLTFVLQLALKKSHERGSASHRLQLSLMSKYNECLV